jgi:TolB-like protein
VWARSYDRSAPDVLSVQSEIAGLIAREIDEVLSGSSGVKLTGN